MGQSMLLHLSVTSSVVLGHQDHHKREGVTWSYAEFFKSSSQEIAHIVTVHIALVKTMTQPKSKEV